MPKPSEYWKLADNLTVVQAALLIVGEEPSGQQEYILGWNEENRPEHFNAVFSAIKNSVTIGILRAESRFDAEPRYQANQDIWLLRNYVESEYVVVTYPPDGLELVVKMIHNWQETTIAVNDLKAWLLDKNFKPSFFFEETSSNPDYLHKDHPRYSAKLAAAVNVWLAMEDSNLYKGKSPKTAMSYWLESRYIELGLIYQEGINNTAIEECTKVANWNDKGGATKTP
jgi:hypothetical protein